MASLVLTKNVDFVSNVLFRVSCIHKHLTFPHVTQNRRVTEFEEPPCGGKNVLRNEVSPWPSTSRLDLQLDRGPDIQNLALASPLQDFGGTPSVKFVHETLRAPDPPHGRTRTLRDPRPTITVLSGAP